MSVRPSRPGRFKGGPAKKVLGQFNYLEYHPTTRPWHTRKGVLSIPCPVTCLTSCLSQLQIYEGAYHILHKELPEVTNSVFREINTWVSQRTAAMGTGSPP